MVAARIRKELDEIGLTHKAAVVDIPLLYESNMEFMANEVWCVYVPKREQIRRLRARDGLTYEQALMRLKSQMDPREKCRRADHVIRTDGLPLESAAQAVRLWQEALIKLGGTRFD
jgi:dephospho-CoA kinase